MALHEEIEQAAKAGYEERIRAQFPRLVQRTLSWAELTDQQKEIERKVARASLVTAERVRNEYPALHGHGIETREKLDRLIAQVKA